MVDCLIGVLAKDAFETAGDHDCPCHSCMENNNKQIASFSTISQDLLRMLQEKRGTSYNGTG